jgi:hypothetical protein
MRPVPAVVVLLLSSLALLCAAPVSAWAAPTITWYRVQHVTTLSTDLSGNTTTYWTRQIGVRVHSESPTIGLAAVTVTEGDVTHWNCADRWPANDGTGDECFCTSWDDPELPAGGPYTLSACDWWGAPSEAVISTAPTRFLEPAPEVVAPAPGGVIAETSPTFTWLPFPGFAGDSAPPVDRQGVGVSGDAGCLWRQCDIAPGETSAAYGADPLLAGQVYWARVWEFAPDVPLDGPVPGAYAEQTGRVWAFAEYSPVPTIQSADICRARCLCPDDGGTEFYHEGAKITALDYDGWQDLCIATQTPDGLVLPCMARCGSSTNDGRYTLTQANAHNPPTLSAGSYTVVAVDPDGNATSLVSGPVSEVPPMHQITYPSNGAVLPATETAPTFSWASDTCAIYTCVCVVDRAANDAVIWVKRDIPGCLTGVTYNDDGSSALAQLLPGGHYLVKVRRHYYDEDCCDGVAVDTWTGTAASFALYSPYPAIERVDITRNRDTLGSGFYQYSQGFAIRVCNPNPGGAAALASIAVTAPDGQTFTREPGSPGWREVDPLTVVADWWEMLNSPASGLYSVTAYTTAGESDTATSGSTQDFLDPSQSILYPALGSTIEETQPTFSWSSPDPGAWISVFEESNPDELWGGGLDPADSATKELPYGGPDLQPGYAHKWYLRQSRDVTPVEAGDPRVTLHDEESVVGLFAVYDPALAETEGPSLPGKLVHTGCCSFGTSQYERNPNMRTWIGPAGAEVVAWSPDGTELLYNGPAGQGLWVDPLDGSAPQSVAGVVGWSDADWSPDGARLVVSSTVGGEGYRDLQVMGRDGSDAQTILAGGGHRRYPHWSPDGRWIAYQFRPDDWTGSGAGLWLVHPDGSADHQVACTGLAGHPEYSFVCADVGDWSPDGEKLVVAFRACNADGLGVPGIGVIGAGGGLVTPIFTASADYACCAGPGLPTWATDGSGIVFASGHHLTPDPDWINGKLEPGVELWESAPDGSGAPVRLTHNHTRELSPVWWTPNTKQGTGASITVGGATVTFRVVDADGHTAIFMPETRPAPPAGYAWAGDAYHITTTAAAQGSAQIALRYNPALVPGGKTGKLALLHLVGDSWVNVTTEPDPKAGVVRGSCPLPKGSGNVTDLSLFAVAVRAQ